MAAVYPAGPEPMMITLRAVMDPPSVLTMPARCPAMLRARWAGTSTRPSAPPGAPSPRGRPGPGLDDESGSRALPEDGAEIAQLADLEVRGRHAGRQRHPLGIEPRHRHPQPLGPEHVDVRPVPDEQGVLRSQGQPGQRLA